MVELVIKDQFLIKTETQLREQFGETTDNIWAKATDFITEPMRKFIELSPFCCLSSRDNEGKTDISPRGDAPGFITVANSGQLLIPDRPGNRRYDTIRNFMQTPQVSLLFMIPGIPITVRVNGTAQVSCDPTLLSQFAVKERLPKMVIIVGVQEAYGHCAKAIARGKIWEPDYQRTRHEVPSLADLMTHHLAMKNDKVREVESIIEQDLRDSLY